MNKLKLAASVAIRQYTNSNYIHPVIHIFEQWSYQGKDCFDFIFSFVSQSHKIRENNENDNVTNQANHVYVPSYGTQLEDIRLSNIDISTKFIRKIKNKKLPYQPMLGEDYEIAAKLDSMKVTLIDNISKKPDNFSVTEKLQSLYKNLE